MGKRKRKLCIVIPGHWAYRMAGAEYQASLLLDELINRNTFEIYYLNRRLHDRSKSKGYQAIKIADSRGLRRKGFFFDFRKLYKILCEIEPDVLYQRVGCAYTGISAYYAKKNMCKLVWHIANDMDVLPKERNPGRNWIFPYVEKKFLEYGILNADTIIAQTRQQGELLKQHYGRMPSAIIPNMHPLPRESITKTDPVKILWIGNLKFTKRPEIFMSLAQDLSNLKDVKFFMIGSLAAMPNLSRVLKETEKRSNLQYVGEIPQEQVNRMLALGHILVNTSLYEGFSNTFIQAWMRKVPVVSLNIDPDGLISDRGLGLVSETYEGLKRNLVKLIEEPEMRTRIGESAQAYAFEKHSLSNIDYLVQHLNI